jgi:hypothetical protein
LISTKGAQLESNIEGLIEGAATRSLSYLEIPLNFQYRLANGLTFSAGPFLGFLVSAKNKYDYDYTEIDPNTFEITTINESGNEDYKKNCNSMDFGINFGLGYMTESGFGVGFNYSKGLSAIEKDIDPSESSVIGIGLSYMLKGN